jgi:hypothetical protein
MQSSTSRVWFVLALFSLSILVSCDSGGGTPGSEEPSEVSVDVTGTVTSAENDEPIGGASIEILRADNDNTLASATTSGDGSYEATFTIEESETPNQLKVRVSAGRFMDKAVSVDFQSSVSRDVELQTGVVEASVSGVVADTTNDDPIEGAVVTGVRPDSSEQLFETTTSGSGKYEASFEIEATSQPSDIVLSVNADGFESKELTIAFTEEVSKDVKLEAKTTEATASGLVDRSDTGDPVTNATVIGSPAGNSGQLFETTTNEAGEYEVTFEVRVPDEPDEIAVGASAEDFEDSEQTVSFGNEISADLSLSPSEVTVTTSGTITAELDDSTVEGAEVSIFPAGDNNGEPLASTTSEMGGAYEVSFSTPAPDAPDELRLEVKERRFADTSLTVEFSESVSQDIALPSIEIGSAEELQAIQTDSNFPLDGYYVQTSDIDATGFGGVDGFQPIGDETIPFSGKLDGNSFTITGLTINRGSEGNVALIKRAGNALLRSVVLADVDIDGQNNVAGFIATDVSTDGAPTIRNSKVTGNISGFQVAGLISTTEGGEIRNSEFSGTLSGNGAGLVSRSERADIYNSESHGTITTDGAASGSAAGLVLTISDAVVERSLSTMNVRVRDPSFSGGVVGGLAGNASDATIRKSVATGSVEGEARTSVNAGGLVGEADFGTQIEASYATGSVSGAENVGGLLGSIKGDARVVGSYSTGSVSDGERIGGIVGSNGGETTESYWDTETSGRTTGVGRGDATGTTGLTTSEMQGDSAEENMGGFNFQNTWRVVMGDYPALQWEE